MLSSSDEEEETKVGLMEQDKTRKMYLASVLPSLMYKCNTMYYSKNMDRVQ